MWFTLLHSIFYNTFCILHHFLAILLHHWVSYILHYASFPYTYRFFILLNILQYALHLVVVCTLHHVFTLTAFYILQYIMAFCIIFLQFYNILQHWASYIMHHFTLMGSSFYNMFWSMHLPCNFVVKFGCLSTCDIPQRHITLRSEVCIFLGVL